MINVGYIDAIAEAVSSQKSNFTTDVGLLVTSGYGDVSP